MDEQSPQLKKQPKKRRWLLPRIVLSLLALAMVLAAAALIIFRDTLNLDAAKRWFKYRALVRSDSGQAEAFHYDGTLSDTFAVLDGDLLVCSHNAVSLYSGSGTRYVSQPVSLRHPVVDSNGSTAVVYGAGEGCLYVIGQRALIWSAEDLEGVLAAHLNRQGQLTVVTQSSGYRGAVTVYGADWQPMVTVGIASSYVMDAALSDDGKTLAILTVAQQGEEFTSTLSLYTLSAGAAAGASGRYTPDASVELGSGVFLSLRHSDSHLWALGDQRLCVVDREGTLAWHDWSGRYLKLYDLGGAGFAAALLGRYRAGSQADLRVVDENGALAGSLELNEQVLSLSAAGKYLAVLTGSRLDIYTADLTLYASLNDTHGARKVLLSEDGSAVLVAADNARFYVP